MNFDLDFDINKNTNNFVKTIYYKFIKYKYRKKQFNNIKNIYITGYYKKSIENFEEEIYIGIINKSYFFSIEMENKKIKNFSISNNYQDVYFNYYQKSSKYLSREYLIKEIEYIMLILKCN